MTSRTFHTMNFAGNLPKLDDTCSDIVRVTFNHGYIEFAAYDNYVEVRCMGGDFPVMTAQAVSANVMNLYPCRGVRRVQK